jgi:hypothetical protein
LPARGGDGQPVEERAGVPRSRESREKGEERGRGGERAGGERRERREKGKGRRGERGTLRKREKEMETDNTL